MARQAPTYASHIAQIRQQAMDETAAERGRLQGQLGRVQAEMKRLQGCCEADRQATQDLMEVEKIQVMPGGKGFQMTVRFHAVSFVKSVVGRMWCACIAIGHWLFSVLLPPSCADYPYATVCPWMLCGECCILVQHDANDMASSRELLGFDAEILILH